MSEEYIREILQRGRELALLDEAAGTLAKEKRSARWLVAAALGALAAMLPTAAAAAML